MKANVPKFTIAICSSCGKKAPITHGKEMLDNNIERAFFECGKCGFRATILYMDDEIRQAMEKQKALYESGNHDAAQENEKRLQTMTDALRVKMEGA